MTRQPGQHNSEIVLRPLHHISGLGRHPDQLTPEQKRSVDALKEAVRDHDAVQACRDWLGPAENEICVRFLIARQWNEAKAATMLLDALRWRARRPSHRWFVAGSRKDEERARRFHFCAETGKIRVSGTDRHGRAVMVFDNSRENTSDPTNMIEYLAWNMELCYRTMTNNADKIMLVIHLKHNSVLNQPAMSVTRETIQILSGVFPESLGTCVLFDAPRMFSTFFNAVKPFIDPVTRSKIYFMSGDISDGSRNATIMNDLVGPDWRKLTGVGQPVLSTGHYSDFLKREIDASPGFLLEPYWRDVQAREEAACRQAAACRALKVAGGFVEEMNGTKFLAVRDRLNVPDDFLEDFSFTALAPGGGKGGNLMGFTPDRKFIIKEMNQHDHNSLLSLTDAYLAHIGSGPSLLCEFVGHFKHPSYKTPFCVMRNCLAMQGPGEWAGVYDLKGTADDKTIIINGAKVRDVHKRFYNVHLWGHQTFWSEERKTYYNGKKHAATTTFPVTPLAFASLRRAVARDCTFLADHSLMDYSLIMGVRVMPLHQAIEHGFLTAPTADQAPPAAQAAAAAAAAAEEPAPGRPDSPGCPTAKPTATPPVSPRQQASQGTTEEHEGQEVVRVGAPFACLVEREVHVYCAGVIDFLQPWNAAKVVANKIKFMESNKSTVHPSQYAPRFHRFILERFVPDAAEFTPDAARRLAQILVKESDDSVHLGQPGDAVMSNKSALSERSLSAWTRTLSLHQAADATLHDPDTRAQYERWATCRSHAEFSSSARSSLGSDADARSCFSVERGVRWVLAESVVPAVALVARACVSVLFSAQATAALDAVAQWTGVGAVSPVLVLCFHHAALELLSLIATWTPHSGDELRSGRHRRIGQVRQVALVCELVALSLVLALWAECGGAASACAAVASLVLPPSTPTGPAIFVATRAACDLSIKASAALLALLCLAMP